MLGLGKDPVTAWACFCLFVCFVLFLLVGARVRAWGWGLGVGVGRLVGAGERAWVGRLVARG